jgi:predicted RNase H-like nuclease
MATKNFNTQSKGKIGEGQFAYSVEVEGQASREAPKVEAARAFLDYREAQKDALAKEDIPLGYKEFVKNYFDSIEPPK